MSMDIIDRHVESEEEALSEELAQGNISIAEYNQKLRELYREAKEYAREEETDYYDDDYHN